MTVSASSIERFLRRPLNDFRWMKDISEKEIDKALEDLKPRFKVPMRRHQKIGFLLAIAQPGVYYQYEMGLGKTGLSLEVIVYLYQHGLLKKALVLVPMNELIDGWIEEIQKWGIKIPYLGLKGSSDDKWYDLERFKEGIILVSYPALVHMVCTRKTTRGKTKMVVDQDAVVEFAKGVGGVWFDEITKCKNKTSLTFMVCDIMSRIVPYTYGLAGRVFGRDPVDAWAQFYLIDQGSTFGYSFNFFKEVFFIKKKSYWGGPFNFDFKFNKERDEDFNRMMGNSSLRFSAEECIDMPEFTYIRKYVTLPLTTLHYYKEALAEIRRSRGNFTEIKHAFIRMRQISSGYVGLVDEDSGDRAKLEFPENPKLDMLMELIDQMPDNRKCVVGIDFNWSGHKISQELTKAKIKHGFLYAGTKDWDKMKYSFDHDPKFRVLIVQSKKGSYGLNLQSANYLFYYESPVPVLDRLQSEARIKRQGQKNKVFIYDLLCKGTADEAVLAFHKEGRELYKTLVVDPEEVLRRCSA